MQRAGRWSGGGWSGLVVVVAMALLGPVPLRSQDTRTVTEPVFPTTLCASVAAETTINSAGEPASETADTVIQGKLSSCGSGKAVELTLGSGGQNAFVIKPIAIPTGVTLLVDGGVTLFASLNAADYQVGTPGGSQDQCGVNGTNGNGCNALISLGQASVGGKSSSTNAALMGYGVINGRGYDHPVVSGAALNESWWDLSNDARSGQNTSQNNPVLVQLYHATNSVIYKVTLMNSPLFHVRNTGSSSYPGFTVWGLKLLTPWNARNTDGVDPTGAYNVTVTNSVISDGDDEIAISGSSTTSGYTFSNLLLTSGHGISIGSSTSGGVSNVQASNINFNAPTADSNQEGLRIKSDCSKGGVVSNISYQNVCMQGVTTPIDLNPTYSTTTGSSCPSYQNISYQNLHVLTSSNSINVDVRGLAGNIATLSFNNVVFDKLSSVTSQGAPAYATITPSGPVYPSALATLNTATGATGVTYTATPTVSNSSALACPSSNFPALVGELWVSTAAANNVDQAVSLTNPTTLTLNAMVEPTASPRTYTTASYGSYTGVAVPSGGVQFYDNGVAVGAVQALTANGTLASLTITNPTASSHVYTAKYANDANYPAGLSFGSESVTVSAGPATQLAFSTAPAASVAYGTAPGSVAVAVQDAAGDLTSSTASVTLTVTGPNGYSQATTASAVAGTASFSLGSALPGVGAYSFAASSSGLASATAPEAVTAATLTVTAQPASRIFGDPNPSFSAQITGYVNSDSSSVVSGVPGLTTTALRNSPATTYPITAGVGTLSAANYNFATTGSTLTVTGGAPQRISFATLPSLASGGSYQLAATASSGLVVSYQVQGAGASVVGSTLTLAPSASGQAITVTASQAGNGSYAAAPTAAQTFTAQ